MNKRDRALFQDTKREHFLQGNSKGVMDEHLIHRELYNPNKFDVIMTRNTSMDNYIRDAGIILGPAWAICKADGFLYLPHGYYFSKATNGAPSFPMLVNFGSNIGIGCKQASRPPE